MVGTQCNYLCFKITSLINELATPVQAEIEQVSPCLGLDFKNRDNDQEYDDADNDETDETDDDDDDDDDLACPLDSVGISSKALHCICSSCEGTAVA